MRRFLLRLTVWALVPIVLILSLFLGVLARTGELTRPDALVEQALSGQTSLVEPLYLGGEFQNWYKAQVAWAKGAKVLVLGTSRTMQIRSCMLPGADSFYNGGGGISDLDEVLDYLSRFEEKKLPRLLILGLDQYFFNPVWSGCEEAAQWVYGSSPMDLSGAVIDAARRYGAGSFSLRAVLTAAPGCVGLPACSRQRGFGQDGSYHYGQDAEDGAVDLTFDDARRRITSGVSRFEYGDTVNPNALDRLDEVLDFCDEKGITVVAFLPPYAPSIGAIMQQSGNYGYIDQLPAELGAIFARHESGAALYDFTYMEGVTDEQFVDGFHGGDLVYAEMLRRMAAQGGPLAELTDEETLAALIAGAKNPRVIEPNTQHPVGTV